MKEIYSDSSTIELLSLIDANDIISFNYWLDSQIMRGSFSSFFRIMSLFESNNEKLLMIGVLPKSEHRVYLKAMSKQEKLFCDLKLDRHPSKNRQTLPKS